MSEPRKELGDLLDEMCGIQAAYEMAGGEESQRLDKEMAAVRAKILALLGEARSDPPSEEARPNPYRAYAQHLPGCRFLEPEEHGYPGCTCGFLAVCERAAYQVDCPAGPPPALRENAEVRYGNPLTVDGLVQVYRDWLTSLAFIQPSAKCAAQSFAEFAIGHNVFRSRGDPPPADSPNRGEINPSLRERDWRRINDPRNHPPLDNCDFIPDAGHSQAHGMQCRSYRAEEICKCGRPLYDGHIEALRGMTP